MTKSTKSKAKQATKPICDDEARRHEKMAKLIMYVLGGGLYRLNNLHDKVVDTIAASSDEDDIIRDGDMIDGGEPFNTVFTRLVAEGKIVKFDENYYQAAEPVGLPDYTFPRRIFGNDKLRDDLRKWLLDWHNANPRYASDGSLAVWQRGKDRDIKMLDATLTAIAPFFIELLAPRAGSPIRAAKLLAERFEATAQEMFTDEAERAEDEDMGWSFPVEWFRAEDVNVYSGFFDEVIGHPRQEP